MSAGVRVSVCIPARDHAEHLAAAIASALADEACVLEVLVHDDASTDATREVVRSFADGRVRYHRHPQAVGVAANRASCVRAARGELVAWLDADDVLLPGGLRARLALLDARPGVVLVHGAAQVVDAAGRELAPWPAPFDHDAVEGSAQALEQALVANELTTSTVMARRPALLAAVADTTHRASSSSDWELWLRLAARGDVGYVAAPVAAYRQHPATISRATGASGERLRSDVLVVERALGALGDRLADPVATARRARAALAAKAVLHAGDRFTAGAGADAVAALELAASLAPGVDVDDLAEATARGDALAASRRTKDVLRRLSAALSATRLGPRLGRLAAADPAWEHELRRVGTAVARTTPREAVVAAIAKWDPTLLDAAGRAGCNFPDRALLGDGYPVDDAQAVAHLDALRATRGVTHLAVPAVSGWWLEHYGALAERLGEPAWQDAGAAIFDLGAAA